MDQFTVVALVNEEDATEASSKRVESFHVAIVEVADGIIVGILSSLKWLKTFPSLLGATEFLQKPISEEKLRNIWQHVVHKAFNAGSITVFFVIEFESSFRYGAPTGYIS